MSDENGFSGLSRLQWRLRVLIACRVSVISALAGVLLFTFVPQARDLFDDITYGALPFSPFAWAMWLLFFAYVFLIWAFPVHYAARSILERSDDWMVPSRLRAAIADEPDCARKAADELRRVRRELRRWIEWTPRVLGAAPFFAVYIGLYKSFRVVEDTQAALEPAAAAMRQLQTLALLDAIVIAAFLFFLVKRRQLFKSGRDSTKKLLAILALCSILAITAVFFFSYFAPFYQAAIAPRALIVPFLFGSLVFTASALAWLSDRFGLPLLVGAIALAFAVTAFNTHFNDLRHLPDAPKNLAQRQIEVAEAVKKWKIANHCERGEGCPPALLVAAEGGASRAAFAAATALGELFERFKELPDNGVSPLAPARRVFALSGVSGGAFGAASIRAALWEALERGGAAPPCKAAPYVWYRATEADAERLVAQNWRACLQALVAGDYLTAAFVGLGFRDNLSPPAYIVAGPTILTNDRAALVERSWESFFDNVINGLKPQPWEAALAMKPETDSSSGLMRPFGYVAAELDKHAGAWLPLLLLNGTSVDQGVRIIASDLISTQPGAQPKEGEAGRAPLYPAAFDLFEMLSTPCPPKDVKEQACSQAHTGPNDVPDRRDGPDVRLSTTAMLSARFPVVSPSGTIRAKDDDGISGDRVVDGGYFENAGLTTALDVARALHEQKITPIVLWVQNDPTIDEEDLKQDVDEKGYRRRRVTVYKTGETPQFPPRAAGAPRLQGADPGWLMAFFSVVSAPFEALAETRNGHALEASELIQRRLEEMNDETCVAGDCSLTSSYFTFKMYKNPRFEGASAECKALAAAKTPPIMSEVSMSWWLSQSVQAELNAQICDERNRKSLDDLMTRLAQKLK